MIGIMSDGILLDTRLKQMYTVSQKNPRDYVFDDNLNSRRPIVITLVQLLLKTMGHWKVVSLSHLTYFVQLPYPGKLLNLKIRRLSSFLLF